MRVELRNNGGIHTQFPWKRSKKVQTRDKCSLSAQTSNRGVGGASIKHPTLGTANSPEFESEHSTGTPFYQPGQSYALMWAI